MDLLRQQCIKMIEQVPEVIASILPIPFSTKPVATVQSAHYPIEVGVLIGITGDAKGRMIIDADRSVFRSIGEVMYGMVLEDSMLESFIGEVGNMIAGNFAAKVYKQNVTIDISPPTVIAGNTKLYGFENASHLSIDFGVSGEIHILLKLDEK